MIPPLVVSTVVLDMITSSMCSGVGRDARRVRRAANEAYAAFEDNVTYGHQRQTAMKRLTSLREGHATHGWDGYGALPINDLSYGHAMRFLNLYPAEFPLPEMSVDPDGEVSFEWYAAPRSAFTMSISPEGRLSFAGLFGSDKVEGNNLLVDGISGRILENIQRVGLDA